MEVLTKQWFTCHFDICKCILEIETFRDFFSEEYFAVLIKYYRLPWNQETLLGYIAEIVCMIVTDEGYLLTSGAVLLLLISMCLHHRAFSEMFRRLLRAHEHPNRLIDQKKLLCKAIRFHNSVKS